MQKMIPVNNAIITEFFDIDQNHKFLCVNINSEIHSMIQQNNHLFEVLIKGIFISILKA